MILMIHCSDYEWWRMAVDGFPRMCGCCWQGLRRWSDETWRPRGSWRNCQANWMHLALFKFKGMQETFSSQVVIETFFFSGNYPCQWQTSGIRLESLSWRITGRSTQKCSVGSASKSSKHWTIMDYPTIIDYPHIQKAKLVPRDLTCDVNHCLHMVNGCHQGDQFHSEKKFLRHSVTRV